MVLSGGSFEVTQVGNLEITVTAKGDLLGNSEVTRVGNKLGMSYG